MIVVTYMIDKTLYNDPSVHHNIAIVTTEYSYKATTLVHVQLGQLFHNRLNHRLNSRLGKNVKSPGEHFLLKKGRDKSKGLTRSEFETKLKQFDMRQTEGVREIVEDYCYTDMNRQQDIIGITITIKRNNITAVIDFKSLAQYKNFVPPAWLIEFSGDESNLLLDGE